MLVRRRSFVGRGKPSLSMVAGTLFVVVVALGFSFLFGISENLALITVLGIGLFVAAFLNTDFALAVLILSMLLSPEFGTTHAE